MRWREETSDDQAGVWIWESGDGPNPGGVYAGYVPGKRSRYIVLVLLTLTSAVFETELMGIAGVSKDEL